MTFLISIRLSTSSATTSRLNSSQIGSIAPSMPGWTTCHGSDSALPSIRSAMPAIAGRVLRLPRQPKRSPCNPPDRSAPAQFAGKRGFIQKARVGEVRIRARIWASGNGVRLRSALAAAEDEQRDRAHGQHPPCARLRNRIQRKTAHVHDARAHEGCAGVRYHTGAAESAVDYKRTRRRDGVVVAAAEAPAQDDAAAGAMGTRKRLRASSSIAPKRSS